MNIRDSAHPFEGARADFLRKLPEHFERLTWSAERIRTHQTTALRSLLRIALERSPFHAERLAGRVGDVDRFELADLPRLPVMTKREMMVHYDRVPTDRRLTKAAVEGFLAEAGSEPSALFGEYLVLASGGSSGVRGAFVQHIDQVSDYMAGILRGGLAKAGGGRVPHDQRVAIVAAESSIHATRSVSTLIDGTVGRVTFAPATRPIEEVVERVMAAQPTLLVGYTGALVRLAQEQLAGRLAIHPAMIISTSEELTRDAITQMTSAFGTAPVNSFGSSEGLGGAAPPGDPVFTFASDLAHIEFVDEKDQLVDSGERAHHVLITNLLNTTQPLIRYRLDDRMTEMPTIPGLGHTRATLEGRSGEIIRFGSREVHPMAVGSILTRTSTVSEFQVRNEKRSMRVDIVTHGPTDIEKLGADLSFALEKAGVSGIEVMVRVVSDLARDPQTGKIRRFMST